MQEPRSLFKDGFMCDHINLILKMLTNLKPIHVLKLLSVEVHYFMKGHGIKNCSCIEVIEQYCDIYTVFVFYVL